MTLGVTYAQAFRDGVREEMARDDRILIMGTDLSTRGGHWAQVKGLGEEFGSDRVRDTPISEAAMMAAGVGAAMSGLRPIVDLNFLDFIFGAMDEVANQAAKVRYMWGADLPLVIRATTGVAFGAAQHNNSLEAWFAHLPGLHVAMPASPADVKGMIKSALRGQDPVLFLMHKGLSSIRGEVGSDDDLVPLGVADRLREGSDLVIVAYAGTVGKALQAAESLAETDINAEVIDLRTVSPIDHDTVLGSVARARRALVVGEAPPVASIASEVAATISERLFDVLSAPVIRLSAKDAPVPHSPPLIEALLPQVEDIIAAARGLMEWGGKE